MKLNSLPHRYTRLHTQYGMWIAALENHPEGLVLEGQRRASENLYRGTFGKVIPIEGSLAHKCEQVYDALSGSASSSIQDRLTVGKKLYFELPIPNRDKCIKDTSFAKFDFS